MKKLLDLNDHQRAMLAERMEAMKLANALQIVRQNELNDLVRILARQAGCAGSVELTDQGILIEIAGAPADQ